MATYVIGDVQGCYHSLRKLLDEIRFDLFRDRLWLVGDLINRGAGSLEVLRLLVEYHTQRPSSVTVVLGNHDLHALAAAEGLIPPRSGDTLQPILQAPDRDILLTWLRHCPLVHAEKGYLMVHAGLLPQWNADMAMSLAAEVEDVLQGAGYKQFLASMYGNQPDRWDMALQGADRLRLIVNAMTRLRVCKPDGSMDFRFKGEYAEIPPDLLPWFKMPQRKSAGSRILFGHWSALGLYQDDNVVALDTGCVWGGKLTALRLEDDQLFQVPCDPRDKPMSITD